MDARLSYEVARLWEWVKKPENDGLLSYTERILVSLASGDRSRAPLSLQEFESYEEFFRRARAELDGDQLEVLDMYLRSSGKGNLKSDIDPDLQSRILEDLEILADSTMEDGPKRKALFEISQAIGYHMEKLI